MKFKKYSTVVLISEINDLRRAKSEDLALAIAEIESRNIPIIQDFHLGAIADSSARMIMYNTSGNIHSLPFVKTTSEDAHLMAGDVAVVGVQRGNSVTYKLLTIERI